MNDRKRLAALLIQSSQSRREAHADRVMANESVREFLDQDMQATEDKPDLPACEPRRIWA